MLWGARTPHKVCDTNISMTCFHKLTVNVFDYGTNSTTRVPSYARYFDCWGTSKPVLAIVWGANRPPSPLNSVYFVLILQLNVEFWKSYFCSVSSYKVKKQLIEIVKNMITFAFWKSSERFITNIQRFAKSYKIWFAI